MEDKEILNLFLQLRKSFSNISNDKTKNLLKKIHDKLGGKLDKMQLISGQCPHVYYWGKTVVSSTVLNLYQNLKINLEKFIDVEQPSGVYCKVCGELLFDKNTEGETKFIAGVRVVTNQYSDHLSDLIWKEAIYYISTYVRINININVKQLAGSMVTAIRPIISDYNIKLLKSKTNTTDSITDSITIYIDIYIMALLCAIMVINPNKLQFGRQSTKHKSQSTRYKGGNAKVSKKQFEKFVLTTSLNLIILTKDSIYKKLKYMTVDLIKEILLKEAYPWAQKISHPIKITNLDQDSIIHESPIFMYVNMINNYIHKTSHEISISKLFNTDEKKLPDNVFSKIVERLDKIKYPIHNYIDKYKWLSYYSTIQHTKLHYTFLPRHPIVQKWLDDNKELNMLENTVLKLQEKENVPIMYKVMIVDDIYYKLNDFRPEAQRVEDFYCGDGTLSKGGKYKFKNKSKYLTVTNKQIAEYYKKYITSKVISKQLQDFLKSTYVTEVFDCKVKGKIDFKTYNDLSAFYEYYLNRCPENGLHNIVDWKCEKCGLDTKAPRVNNAYYKKYNKQFIKLEKKKNQLTIDELQRTIEENKKDKFVNHKVEKPKYSLNKVAKYSQLLGVKYNILVNLGINELYKMDDIKNAVVNPSQHLQHLPTLVDWDIKNQPHTSYSTQFTKLENYILMCIRDYTLMTNLDNSALIPLYLKNVKVKVKPHDFTYISQINKLKDKVDYKYLANFALEYLAELIIYMYGISPKLAKAFSDKILSLDKNFSLSKTIINPRKLKDMQTEIIEEQTDENTFSFNEAFDVESINDIWDT